MAHFAGLHYHRNEGNESVNSAIQDIEVLVTEVVNGVGALKVAKMMENDYGWVNVNVFNIPAYIVDFFENEVGDYDFEEMIDTVCHEFWCIATAYNYEITLG